MVDVEDIVVEEELNEPEAVVVEEHVDGEEVVVNEEIVSEETSFEDGDEGQVEEVVEEEIIETEEPVETEEVSETEEVVESENFEIKFELSHDDIRMGLYELLSARSDNGYYCAWIVEVYDNKFIYEDCEEYKFFRQGYSRDGENITLDGEAVEVFNEWLSKDEQDALDALKSSYSELKAFKDNYDAEMIKAAKDEIFANAIYDGIRETEEFKQLVADAEQYGIDELNNKVDLLYANSMKAQFAKTSDKPEQRKSVSFNYQAKPNKIKQAYAGLFNKD